MEVYPFYLRLTSRLNETPELDEFKNLEIKRMTLNPLWLEYLNNTLIHPDPGVFLPLEPSKKKVRRIKRSMIDTPYPRLGYRN